MKWELVNIKDQMDKMEKEMKGSSIDEEPKGVLLKELARIWTELCWLGWAFEQRRKT